MKKEYYNKERGIFIERIPDHSTEWYDRRNDGIGASDVGRILGLSKYKGSSAIELFYEKIGIKPILHNDNKYFFMGRYLEDSVAELWQYHDGVDDSYVENYNNNNIIRRCQRINGIISNKKYPHLYANLDRTINIGSFSLLDGSLLETQGVLECKTGTLFQTKTWEDGVNPAYIAQVTQQMMCFGVEYSELAYLELDTRTLTVVPIILNNNLKESIERETYTFWHKMVIPAKELAQEYFLEANRGNNDKAQKILNEIEKYEPSADSSESYKDFMNKRYLSEPDIILADDNMVENLKELSLYKQISKGIEPLILLRENKIRKLWEHQIL